MIPERSESPDSTAAAACKQKRWLCLVVLLVCSVFGLSSSEAAEKPPPPAPANLLTPSPAINLNVFSRLLRERETFKGHLPELTVIHPDDQAAVPADMASIHISWEDTFLNANCWLLTFTASSGDKYYRLVTEKFYLPEKSLWEKILSRSTGGWISIEILGLNRYRNFAPVTRSRRRVRISEDDFDATIVFKRVPLPFSKNKSSPEKSQWLAGEIQHYSQPKVILDGLGSCANCHTFSADGRSFGIDIDHNSDKGGYLIGRVEPNMELNSSNYLSWNDLSAFEGDSLGLFSTFSANGRFVATTVEEISLFAMFDNLMFSQLFFPIAGKIGIYDRKHNTHFLLPGAGYDDRVQTCPQFSPDGKTMVFSVAAQNKQLLRVMKGKTFVQPDQHETIFDLNKRYRLRFNLYTMDFNTGRGGVPEPLAGASYNGKSNYFPRFSPDGNWIVFCQSDNGLVLQPDSRLCVIPVNGGVARELACNTPRMNSWHSFTPNGRWLVFASKAISPYTEVLISHFNDDGTTSPPIALHRFNRPGYAAVIPEAVSFPEQGLERISVNLAGKQSQPEDQR